MCIPKRFPKVSQQCLSAGNLPQFAGMALPGHTRPADPSGGPAPAASRTASDVMRQWKRPSLQNVTAPSDAETGNSLSSLSQHAGAVTVGACLASSIVSVTSLGAVTSCGAGSQKPDLGPFTGCDADGALGDPSRCGSCVGAAALTTTCAGLITTRIVRRATTTGAGGNGLAITRVVWRETRTGAGYQPQA